MHGGEDKCDPTFGLLRGSSGRSDARSCGMASERLHSPVSGRVFLFSESVTLEILHNRIISERFPT